MCEDPQPKTSRPISLVLASRQPGRCRGCQAEIDWFETAKGRPMPMRRGAQPVAVVPDGARLALFSADDTHWSTCPDATAFKRRPAPRS